MSKLTRAERDQIIYNEAHGVLHPLYYCYTTKTGNIQIRKRKEPISVPVKTCDEQVPEQTPPEEHSNDEKPKKKEEDYDSVSNKQLLEKMLEILEKNSTSNNQNLSSPEREKETEDNKKYIENIKEKEQPKEEEEAASPRGFLCGRKPLERSERGTQEEERHEEPEQTRERAPRAPEARPRPKQRGRRFIDERQTQKEEFINSSQPIKKVRGRIL